MNKIVLWLIILVALSNSFGCIRMNFDNDDSNLILLHEKTFPITEGKLLKFITPSGRINISSWDKNEVYIKIMGNETARKKIDFTFDNNNDVVEVEAKTKSSFFFGFNNFRLNYEIKVPKSFNTEGKTSGGDIYIENVNGVQHLKTSGGDVNARNLMGEFDCSTSGGDFKVENLKGRIRLSTSGGNINAKDFFGDFIASTSGGDIKLISNNASIKATTSGGNITLDYQGENKGIELATSGGNIDIQLPKNFNASARLRTSGGNIESDFKGNNAIKISATRFEADINSGGNRLDVSTSGGNIDVKSK